MIKIGDKVVLDANDELALFNLNMSVDMLIGLTLLKIGLAQSLSDMIALKEHFTFVVDGHDLREIERQE